MLVLRIFTISVLLLFPALLPALADSASIHGDPEQDPVFHDRFECPEIAVADAGDDLQVEVGVPVFLDGSGSTGSECDILFLWSLVSQPAGSSTRLFDDATTEPIFIADQAGTYEIELAVFQNGIISDSDSMTIVATGELESEAEIGPDGGAVGLPDGAVVLIPPDALDTAATIAIEEVGLPPGSVVPPTAEVAGGVYQLTPSGQVFQRPAQIVIPYDPSLLPPEFEEGGIRIYRQDDSWPEFHMLGNDETGDNEPMSDSGQRLDTENRLLSAFISTFSHYTPAGTYIGFLVSQVTLTSPNAEIEVLRPPSLRSTRPQVHQCRNNNNTQLALATRTAGQIDGIVAHSSNGGNHQGVFSGPVAWAMDACVRFFAHYYIDRNGEIVQLVDDLHSPEHAGAGSLGLTNANTIGIELYLNVGEPYDGRQIAALIRLVDYLMDQYALPRPQRDPATGLVSRNRVDIGQGGDRIVAHVDLDPDKCDPSGTFMDSGFIKPELVGIDCRDSSRPEVAERPLSVGSSNAPALMDVLLDAIAVLDRDGQHTGIINTHGGDAFEFGLAGAGGLVTLSEDAALVASEVGTQELTRWQQNEPALLGPGPLIVAPGTTVSLAGPMHAYTDVIIDGTLNLTDDVEFRLTGTFYVSPRGRIVARNGRNGGDLTVYSRGVPIVQGLIDARGEDGVSGTPDGGHGGNVEFVYAHPGLMLAPTLYTRGGDADYADLTLPGGGPKGGDGGDVTIQVGQSQVFLGGGIGPVIGNATVPPWRSGPIDPILLEPGRWAGDFLPPPPPFTRSSIDVSSPASGERVRKWTTASQPGFQRGFLTAGGMGGWGQSALPRHGGPAGNGGNVQINLDSTTRLTLRDIDIATGAEIETLRHAFFIDGGTQSQVVCTASGAHGGFGSSNGNGGAGGDAGSFILTGGVLNPAPSQHVNTHEIRGFPAGDPMQAGDNNCSTGRITVGQVIEARDANGIPLYRVRLSASGASLLGGLGGIPSQSGVVGTFGASGTVTGLPLP